MFVPGNVQRDTRCRPNQLEDRAAILEFLQDVARLALSGKARKAGSTSPNSPGRHCDTERLGLFRNSFDVYIPSAKYFPKVLVILLYPGLRLFVLRGN